MANFLIVLAPQSFVEIEADECIEVDSLYVLKSEGQPIAKFSRSAVGGWFRKDHAVINRPPEPQETAFGKLN